ncbi:hypothetical protein BT96DRAFT_947872 [Gymnopus androsaceus JB14]|uniref:Uncharacterized protein n=1 Tax=Gymnopus androsaceus JB14 TaxID=1447944 RepID=A0A6A4GRN0_9AGAR|nr:hypothetical protein BT96DRAFT_947872 [Gymnopus androsaceus JB14]
MSKSAQSDNPKTASAIPKSQPPQTIDLLRKHKLHLGKVGKEHDPSEVSDWINKTVEQIQKSGKFKGKLDATLKMPKQWKTPPIKATCALVAFQSTAAAKEHFRMAKDEEVKALAATKHLESPSLSTGLLITHLKVISNQGEFQEAMLTTMDAFCQIGALGPCKLVLLSGFRNQKNQVIAYKTTNIRGHLIANIHGYFEYWLPKKGHPKPKPEPKTKDIVESSLTKDQLFCIVALGNYNGIFGYLIVIDWSKRKIDGQSVLGKRQTSFFSS